MGNKLILVEAHTKFRFDGLCPYCKGTLTYVANSWEQDDDGLWVADGFDSECSNEPEPSLEEWAEWFILHNKMPYVYQMPVDEKVKEEIKSKYRFNL